MTGAAGMTGTDALAGLSDALLAWLPEQRWVPGKGRRLEAVGTLSHQWIPAPDAEPAVEHAVIGATFADAGPEEQYQLLLGSGARPSGDLEYSVIGSRDGRTV